MDAWKIAAVILIERSESLHYNELTDLVLKTRMTGLGNSSKGTENLTLHTYMTRDHRDFFIKDGDGFFSINPDKRDNINLNNAKLKYHEFLKEKDEAKQEEIQQRAREDLLQLELQKKEDEKQLEIATNDIDSLNYENIEMTEGAVSERFVSYYERKPELRAAAIKIHGTKCMVSNCNFDFEIIYGIRGKNYIEVHHIKPLSSRISIEKINPKLDMVVVCSNCHRIIHREKDNILTIEQVNELIKK